MLLFSGVFLVRYKSWASRVFPPSSSTSDTKRVWKIPCEDDDADSPRTPPMEDFRYPHEGQHQFALQHLFFFARREMSLPLIGACVKTTLGRRRTASVAFGHQRDVGLLQTCLVQVGCRVEFCAYPDGFNFQSVFSRGLDIYQVARPFFGSVRHLYDKCAEPHWELEILAPGLNGFPFHREAGRCI